MAQLSACATLHLLQSFTPKETMMSIFIFFLLCIGTLLLFLFPDDRAVANDD